MMAAFVVFGIFMVFYVDKNPAPPTKIDVTIEDTQNRSIEEDIK